MSWLPCIASKVNGYALRNREDNGGKNYRCKVNNKINKKKTYHSFYVGLDFLGENTLDQNEINPNG